MQPRGFAGKLAPILRYIEIAALIAVLAGFAFLHHGDADPGPQLIMIGFSALAVICYLYGFIPPAPTSTESDVSTSGDTKIAGDEEPARKGFKELLPVLLRKTMYIACSVCLIGILFSILHLQGSRELLLIGTAILTPGSLVLIVMILVNAELQARYKGILIRSVPIAAYSIHWIIEFWGKTV